MINSIFNIEVTDERLESPSSDPEDSQLPRLQGHSPRVSCVADRHSACSSVYGGFGVLPHKRVQAKSRSEGPVVLALKNGTYRPPRWVH